MSNRLRGVPQTPRYPSQRRLVAGLGTIFRTNKPANGDLSILARKPNQTGSTFPPEIVRCRLGRDQTTRSLFVKYGTKKFDSEYRHRANVSYKSNAYRKAL